MEDRTGSHKTARLQDCALNGVGSLNLSAAFGIRAKMIRKLATRLEAEGKGRRAIWLAALRSFGMLASRTNLC